MVRWSVGLVAGLVVAVAGLSGAPAMAAGRAKDSPPSKAETRRERAAGRADGGSGSASRKPESRGEARSETPAVPPAEEVVLEETEEAGEAERQVTAPRSPAPRRFWVRAAFAQDFAMLGGTNLCSPSAQNDHGYYCFLRDERATQYEGVPFSAEGDAGRVGTGLVAATSRVAAGLDARVSQRVSLGVSLGVAFRGGPGPRGGTEFWPFSIEGRAAYWFTGDRAFSENRLGVYALLAGGFAQVDARASMVLEDPELGRQTVDVWRKSGRQFAGGGAGLFWPLGDGARLGGVLAEATLRFMFPDAGFAVSPSVGYAYGF